MAKSKKKDTKTKKQSAMEAKAKMQDLKNKLRSQYLNDLAEAKANAKVSVTTKKDEILQKAAKTAENLLKKYNTDYDKAIANTKDMNVISILKDMKEKAFSKSSTTNLNLTASDSNTVTAGGKATFDMFSDTNKRTKAITYKREETVVEKVPTYASQIDRRNLKVTYVEKEKTVDKSTTIKLRRADEILASNLFFPVKVNWYNKFNIYGWIDPFDTDRIVKEFLFFTKPDLNIFNDPTSCTSGLNTDTEHNGKYSLATNPIFNDAYHNHLDILATLESTAKNKSGHTLPFMNILSNAVTSKLDLPGVTAETQSATANIMGVEPQYRGHSFKSDLGYDFTLQFMDTQYLEIYTLAKVYDEYSRLLKLGEIMPKKNHIVNRIIDNQFSVYKFLVGSDGETIIYYAKLTGVFITDVPRSEFGDPPENGFKYSLSFHANFVEDMNPYILSEFNHIVREFHKESKVDLLKTKKDYWKNMEWIGVWNGNIGAVDNRWASYPQVVKYYAKSDDTKDNASVINRVTRRNREYDYRLKWVE